MVKPLSKAQRTRIAADVVSAIQETIDKIDAYFDNNNIPSFRYEPKALMPGDGSVTFNIPSDANRFVEVSNHQKLVDAQLPNALEQIFSKAAKALAILLPGRQLFWSISDKKAGRHMLSVGSPVSNHPHMIDTVLSRWKTPLVRLSYFFEDTDEDHTKDLSNECWHLHLRPDFINGEGHYETRPLIVHAPTVDAAFRVGSYGNSIGATPAPSGCYNQFALRLGPKFTHDDYVEIIEAGTTVGETAATKGKQLFEDLQEKLIQDVKKSAEILRQYADISATLNLMTGESDLSVTPSPLSLLSDFETVQDQQEMLKHAVDALAQHLSRCAQIVHPNMYQADIDLTIYCSRDIYEARNNLYSMNGMIDDLPVHGSLENVHRFIDRATHLAAVTSNAPRRLFAVQTNSNAAPNIMAVYLPSRYTVATSPAHAALIFRDHFSKDCVLREAFPVEAETVRIARKKRDQAVQAYLNI